MDVQRALESGRLTKAELAVFVSGITSMGLEILAVRIVAPQFGSHIYTVGGLLTVFLAALSLGYWQGGKLAKTASNRQMTWILLATAVYIAVVIYASDMLLYYTATIPLGPRYAALPSIVILFGPPTYLLGFISPYAAELSAKEGVGEASGHVYALGTIGSILGAGATTYLLIPSLTIDEIGLLFGLILVGTALVLSLPRPSKAVAVTLVVVTLVLFTASSSAALGLDPRGEVVYQTQTPHQQLEVIDNDNVRTMYLDGARHSALDLEDADRHVFAYTRYFHLTMLLQEEPESVDRVLFIGGGGYTGPQDFEEHYDVTIDVVEIDGEVTRAAETYFGLEQSDSLQAHEHDGRQFLYETDHTYDVIVLDAFKRDQVPFQLTTVEFMTLVDDRLSDDGVVLANVVSAPEGSASEFYRAQYATMDEVFEQVYSFKTSSTPAVQNVQVIATKDETRHSVHDLEARNEAGHIDTDLSKEIDNALEQPATDDVPVLRDDQAAVDALLDPMLGQQYVIEETESSGSVGETNSSSSDRTEERYIRVPEIDTKR
ncbi:spermidine synthase [Natronosalvus amylolyticus]|uniref:spermidine synthase n=1 Tax=Natronosalvus amylolyticus TaxID=2961994 RepID=UPI0020C9A2C6|nr:fused MFS/spermidine synthase [Natronosalvus amylolyticus]